MSEPITCPKCGYTRTERDQAPEWQCPACQVAYVKAAAAASGVVATPVRRTVVEDEEEQRSGPNLRVWLLLALLAVVAVFHHFERERAAEAERAATASRPAKSSPPQPAPAAPSAAPVAPRSEPPPPPVAPPRSSRLKLFSDPEYALLDRDLAALAPQRPGRIDIYFLGVASYAEEDVFLKEVLAVRDLFDTRFDTRGRSLVMINNIHRRTDYPPATVDGLRRALIYLADLADPEEDLVFVHLTSHGSADHQLWFTSGKPLQHLSPAMLKAYVDEARLGYRAFSISACYSGGFIPRLADSRAFVVAAAHPEHKSFGCGNDSEITDFSQAYYMDALRSTHSFDQAFVAAESFIAARERRLGLEPSQPQIYVGDAVKAKLDAVQRQLAAGR